MIFNKEIECERLLLRTYNTSDADDVLFFLNHNREYLKNVIEKDEYESCTVDAVIKILRRKEAGWLVKNMFTWGVWEKAYNQLIGQIMFFKLDWMIGQAEIGSYIDRDFQGKGLITEAKKNAIESLFLYTAITKVTAICRLDNLASQRVNEKLGFTRIREDGSFVYFVKEKLT